MSVGASVERRGEMQAIENAVFAPVRSDERTPVPLGGVFARSEHVGVGLP